MNPVNGGDGALDELAFVDAFVRPDRRARFLELLQKTRARRSTTHVRRRWTVLLTDFEHWVDRRCVEMVPADERAPGAVERRLLALGSPGDVWVMSEARAIDGRRMPLRDALEWLSRQRVYGTILSCSPGELAYFEHCEMADLTWILRRPRP